MPVLSTKISGSKSGRRALTSSDENFRYAESHELNAQLLELPIEKREATFIVILSREVRGLATLVETLKIPSALELATSIMSTFEVNVSFPKFTIETETDLKNFLENMDVRIFSATKAILTRLFTSTELRVRE